MKKHKTKSEDLSTSEQKFFSDVCKSVYPTACDYPDCHNPSCKRNKALANPDAAREMIKDARTLEHLPAFLQSMSSLPVIEDEKVTE